MIGRGLLALEAQVLGLSEFNPQTTTDEREDTTPGSTKIDIVPQTLSNTHHRKKPTSNNDLKGDYVSRRGLGTDQHATTPSLRTRLIERRPGNPHFLSFGCG